jgi:uncharacterized membrane protein (UPF0127 family)
MVPHPMRNVLIYNQNRPDLQPIQVVYCDSFMCRLRGLMFQKEMHPYSGLLLVQPKQNQIDAAIHMFFMNFDIATIWINDQLEVVSTCLARRWRPFYMPVKPARYTLETDPGHLNDFKPGEIIIIKDAQMV